MKLSAILLSNVLFATAILARPRGLAQRQAARAARGSHPLIPVGSIVEGPPNASHIQYSSNWAGAVITSPPAGQTFTSVQGQFTVPKPSTSSTGSYSASAWVGIDGDTYSAAILQAGADFTVTKSGSSSSYSYDLWYEWYPNYAIDFSNFPVTSGNVINVKVTATSTSTGTVVMENLTTGKTVTQSVSAPSSSSHLGGQNAEWIVEDFDSGGSQVAFANFGTVTFTGCVAKTASSTLSVSGATVIEIENSSGQVITDVSIPSSSSVKVTYE